MLGNLCDPLLTKESLVHTLLETLVRAVQVVDHNSDKVMMKHYLMSNFPSIHPITGRFDEHNVTPYRIYTTPVCVLRYILKIPS